MKYILSLFILIANAKAFGLEIHYQAQYDETVAPPQDGANLVPDVEQQNWNLSVEDVYEKKLRFYGGFFLRRKVLVKKELKLSKGNDSIYFFDENKYALVSSRDEARETIDRITAPQTNRPTLFVLVPGFIMTSNSGKYEDWPWFYDMENKVRDYQRNHSSESVLMNIVWSSANSNKSQVRQVSNHIKDFLNRFGTHKWDVVLYGHSRGGIFVHSLSQQLESNKIKNLITVLIDPTAATTPVGDFYPTSKARSVKKGILYIDRETFVPTDILPTVSDRPIPGYDEFTIDGCYGNTDAVCSHSRLTRDYIKSHYFTDDINYLVSLKGQDREKTQYDVLGTPWKHITVRNSHAENLWGDVGGSVDGGNFRGYVTTSSGSGQIVAGQDGLSIGVSSLAVAGDLIISKQGLQAGVKSPGVDAIIAINDEDLARVKITAGGFVESDISLNKGGRVKFEVGLIKVSARW